MIRRWHIRDLLIGFLAMILSVIATVITLLVILLRSRQEIAIGPVYLLIPIAAFALAFYWSLRRSSRPRPPARPPSKPVAIAKSALVGILAMVGATIAYFVWIYSTIPRPVVGLVSVDVLALLHLHWPVLVPVFLGAFICQYRRASRLRSSVNATPAS